MALFALALGSCSSRVVCLIEQSWYKRSETERRSQMSIPIKVYTSDWLVMDGLKVAVVMGNEAEGRRLLRFREDGTGIWVPVEEMVVQEPTMILQDDIARALLDSLTRHYQGASDLHTVRADLIHHRERHDRVVDALIVAVNSSLDAVQQANS